MRVAIIPARSGSKRIKNKNIKKFCGTPIIEIVIKKLINSKIFDKIIVSTDTKKIADIAVNAGASAPFLRSKELSNDFAGTHEVIVNAIKFLKKDFKINPDTICCVYPTAVFFKKKELTEAFKFLKFNKTDYILTAGKATNSMFRSFYYKNKKLNKFDKKYYNFRTQDLPDLYYDIGQFYLAKTSVWLKQKNIFSENSKIIEMPKNRSYDIDNADDWKIAEKLYLIDE
jgi:pseudaminic acid cytidylyltransferase